MKASKLIKLQTKAQECVSREKAKKLIKKYDKKMTKMSEVISINVDPWNPPCGGGGIVLHRVVDNPYSARATRSLGGACGYVCTSN